MMAENLRIFNRLAKIRKQIHFLLLFPHFSKLFQRLENFSICKKKHWERLRIDATLSPVWVNLNFFHRSSSVCFGKISFERIFPSKRWSFVMRIRNSRKRLFFLPISEWLQSYSKVGISETPEWVRTLSMNGFWKFRRQFSLWYYWCLLPLNSLQ